MRQRHSHHWIVLFMLVAAQCAKVDVADEGGALTPDDDDSDEQSDDDDDDNNDDGGDDDDDDSDDDDGGGDDDDDNNDDTDGNDGDTDGDGDDTDGTDDDDDDDDPDTDTADTDTGSPCDGVICDDAPDNVCEDIDHLRQYEDLGECIVVNNAPECEYDHILTVCEFECDSSITPAECKPDPCEGVVCDDPPDDYCEDEEFLMAHDEIGECIDDGVCDYHPQLEECEHGCAIGEGSCKECTVDSDCAPAGKWCNSGNCELCNTNEHCGPDCENCLPDKFCNSAKTKCVECEHDSDCDDGEVCNDDNECEAEGCDYGGVSVAGYCWYASSPSGSCSEACYHHGGYHSATRTYAGSHGTDENCDRVLDALDLGYGSSYEVHGDWGIGCFAYFGDRYRDATYTVPEEWDYDHVRVCACNR